MSTDMGSHQGLVEQFAASRAEQSNPAAWGGDPGARALLLRFLLHAADLCNPCRPAPLGTLWGERVCCEFLAQVTRLCCRGSLLRRPPRSPCAFTVLGQRPRRAAVNDKG